MDRLVEPIRDVSRYHIRPEAAHTILAQASLGVLLRLDDRVDRNSIKSFPLARYAAQYWPTHARVDNVSSRIKDGMERLFDEDKPHFATWLWIYDEYWRDRSLFTVGPKRPKAVPLYYAARLGFRDLAEHLIAKHPEHVNARGEDDTTPIYAAASGGQAESADIVSLLIQHGADVNGRGHIGETPLFQASKDARPEAGQLLLNQGADIDARNNYNNTTLIYAIWRNNLEFARMLLERGADVNARCQNDMTPLHWAAETGRTEFVRLFLEYGADINARDFWGRIPRL